MSNAGNGDGRESEPSGDGLEPDPSRDALRDKRGPADIVLAVFAPVVSDWIIQAGHWLMHVISGL
ncbi:hypothetical protein [Streptomyces sp. NPDC058751]|uniref:hypothetical protein n=1 Tax=Streptomyces sp. NPDC058751 TaxID=3346623 RepID=UPI0036B7C75D